MRIRELTFGLMVEPILSLFADSWATNSADLPRDIGSFTSPTLNGFGFLSIGDIGDGWKHNVW